MMPNSVTNLRHMMDELPYSIPFARKMMVITSLSNHQKIRLKLLELISISLIKTGIGISEMILILKMILLKNMERKIGEKFNFFGYKLKTEKPGLKYCAGCFFYEHRLVCQNKEIRDITGECAEFLRRDGNHVVFVFE